ncbi:MAG: ribonuclease R [Paracoccaceae bacterium]|jgi:ribonuclease R
MDHIPTKAKILEWINKNPTLTAKRDIAKAFGIKGVAARIELKKLLRGLADEGAVVKKRRAFSDTLKLPPVSVLQVIGPDADGDLFARPAEWAGKGDALRIFVMTEADDPALGAGDHILARLTESPDEDHSHIARLIRKITTTAARCLGIFRASSEGGRIMPIDKRNDTEWYVPSGATHDAIDGELVEAVQENGKRLGLPIARIVARLGDPSGVKAVSLIAIHQHGIPDAFPDAVITAAESAPPALLGKREDLRDLPLVTIDPSDARDHDDAVFAESDTDPKNIGGFVLYVAIADVAHYVRPNSVIDREARLRGNSSYFSDRVVPMLPDALSGDLCSLHEGVDRPCLVARMVIDVMGAKISHRFLRAMMRSPASLHYGEVQDAFDGTANPKCASLLESVIKPLYAAYACLGQERTRRQPLDLELPERKIVLSDKGTVVSVDFTDRLDAHKLIEEFMILANVAAAEELIKLKQLLLFRVHEEPSPQKLESLREVAEASGFIMAKGQVLRTSHLNRLLHQARDTDFAELLNVSTLRSMTQAYYHPENLGHFGLSLRSYAHFTSPIRRYSDLIVHRALISAHGWGDDGLSAFDVEHLAETAKKISDTERRSMLAERDTSDRYLAAYLSDRVGAEFPGRVSGVQRFGLFVKLDETGADGLVPIRSLGQEFFHFDPNNHCLVGSNSGLAIGLGQCVTVRLAEAVALTGGVMFELVAMDGEAMPKGRGGAVGKKSRYAPRKPREGLAKADKLKRKLKRVRS